MAEIQTTARPYAEAAFKHAHERNKLAAWSEMLAFTAALIVDAQMQRLIFDPNVGRARLAALVLGIAGDRLDTSGQNFIRVLVENRRLNLLPEIARLYEFARAETEGRITAVVIAPFELNEAQRKQIEKGLQKKLGRTVELRTEIDKGLIGGVIVRAGDLVIDGSIKGRLQQLAHHLNF
jgi:F-type H+-transporting ATPase subunit delta